MPSHGDLFPVVICRRISPLNVVDAATVVEIAV
jgi:hypothetical protein